MKRLDGALSRVSHVTAMISGCAILLMLALIMTDVALKYTINLPVVGTLEIVSQYFMPIAVFFAFIHVQQTRHHIDVPIFTDLMAVRLQHALGILAAVFSAGFLLVAAWASIQKALSATSINQSVGLIHFSLPIWPARWVVPFAYAVMAVQILVQPFTSQTKGTAR